MAKKINFPNVKYFSKNEFDSPDIINSGLLMDNQLILMLDKAREIAGIPFIINSGYRSKSHNKSVGGKKDSSHLKGLAVDISATNSRDRYLIIKSLFQVGFIRIGIRKDFIHCDIDYNKDLNVTWLY